MDRVFALFGPTDGLQVGGAADPAPRSGRRAGRGRLETAEPTAGFPLPGRTRRIPMCRGLGRFRATTESLTRIASLLPPTNAQRLLK